MPAPDPYSSPGVLRTDFDTGTTDNVKWWDDDANAHATEINTLKTTVGGAGLVHTSGTETIGGAKTFTSPPTVPTATADGHAVNKAQAEAIAAGGGGGSPGSVTDNADGTITISGTFVGGGGSSGDDEYHRINVRTKGAVGDGSTNDSAAFAATRDEINANTVLDTDVWVDKRGTRTVYIPPGTYRIVDAGAFFSGGTGFNSGLVFRGAGPGITTIVFDPSTSNQALITNLDHWYRLKFEDITFHSMSPTATFMNSDSDGHAQRYLFDNVQWTGTWAYGINLTGSNNNSELTWRDCAVNGSWTAFLYSATTDTSDQFENYLFDGCHIEYTKGHFIDMAKGGNITVRDGSYIHLGDGSETTSTEQVFFRLGQGVDGFHGRGSTRLHVSGIRVEHRHENSVLADIGWAFGNVSFQSVDTGTYEPLLTTPNNVEQVRFNSSNGYWPDISFKDSQLMGKHLYSYTSGSKNAPRPGISYENCGIPSYTRAVDFISYVNVGSTGDTNAVPPIKFKDCTGAETMGPGDVWDCTVGWPWAMDARVQPRSVSLQMPAGGLPLTGATTHQVKVPLNAIVTRVRAFKAAGGGATGTTFTYTLTNASATQVAQVAPGVAWNTAWAFDSGEIFYQADTDAKRTLTLTSANIAEASDNSYFLIDFLA